MPKNSMRKTILLMSILALCGCAAAKVGNEQFLPAFDPDRARAAIKVTSKSDSGKGSLRAAVDASKPGGTITFSLPKGAKIVLTSGPIALTRKVTISGPGSAELTIEGNGRKQLFTVAAHVAVSIDNVTLMRGSSTAGGAIYNAGSLKLKNDVFSKNTAVGAKGTERAIFTPVRFDARPRAHNGRASKAPHAPSVAAPQVTTPVGDGGAVYNAATLTVSGTTFTNNRASLGSGGAIYNSLNAELNVSGSTFTGNEAAMGGAITNAGSAVLKSDSFKSNTGWPGGGAPVSGGYGYGGAIYAAGKTTVTSCGFTSNVVGGTSSGSFGAGGAIAQYSNVLSVSQSTFTTNSAGGGKNGSWGTGGAIYTTAGTLSLEGSTFTGNRAGGDVAGYGGAIYADESFTGSSNVFGQNSAYGNSIGGYAYGGAVYAGGGLTLSGGSFAGNSAIGGTTANSGQGFGGGIDSELAATLSAISFSTNSATGGPGGSGQGGAIYLGGGSTSTWTSLTFTSNAATSTGALSYSAGGAVVTFAPLTMAGTTSFASNAATSAASGAIGGVGGAAAIEVGPFSFAGSASNNSATTEGGAFWIDDVTSVTNTLITGNHVAGVQSPNDGGGGIYVALGGALMLTGSTLTANSVSGVVASTGGGGIFNAGIGNLANDTLTANSSSIDGGGIENDTIASFTLTNVTVYLNKAGAHGGSLKNLYSDATLTFANSILAGGTGGAVPDDVSNDGAIVSNDYNLVQTAPTGQALTGTTTHNIVGSNPVLGALTNNGGPTPTNADSATSPGIAYIPFSICTADKIKLDQRQYPRNPTGSGFCDIGAFENQSPP